MRIISQRGDASYNFDNLTVWINNTVIQCSIGSEKFCLGSYKTPERAAEVFEEMHKAYTGMPLLFKNINITDDDFRQMASMINKTNIIAIADKTDLATVTEIQTIVYQMPEE